MLRKLEISNFALIENLSFEPSKGFSTITGETGAGKSIILGALGLILGKRIEGTDLFDSNIKCVIEGVFEGNKPNIDKYLLSNDLDVEDELIIRREILPNGKSRAFINDTPAKLSVLSSLGELLINIHSQHGHLELKKPSYILSVLDSYCGLKNQSLAFEELFQKRLSLQKKIKELEENQQQQLLDFDYFSFLFKELEELDVKEGELDSLESELSQLQHGEEIQGAISNSISAFEDEGGAIVSSLHKIEHLLHGVGDYSTQLMGLLQRIKEIRLELEDIRSEFDLLNSSVEFDPERIEECTKRVNAINHLLHKHKLTADVELIHKKQEIESKLGLVGDVDSELQELKLKTESLTRDIEKQGRALSQNRKKGAVSLSTKIEDQLKSLGIRNAVIKFDFIEMPESRSFGFDEIKLHFSANTGKEPKEVTSVASGGELSRIMLSLKSILAEKEKLPSIIFDEIDSGVSGEVANQMGAIMQKMAKTMQVVSITHLPQIAAKGEEHFTVEKNIQDGKTKTIIKKIQGEERIVELAKMLSGDKISGVAKENARILLDN